MHDLQQDLSFLSQGQILFHSRALNLFDLRPKELQKEHLDPPLFLAYCCKMLELLKTHVKLHAVNLH